MTNLIVVLCSFFTALFLSQSIVFEQQSTPCRLKEESVRTFDWHPNGQMLMFGSNCGAIGFDSGLSQITNYLPLERVRDLNSLAYSPDGTLLALSRNYVALNLGEILVWNLESDQIVSNFQDTFTHSPIVWHPTDPVLLVGHWGEPRVLSVASNEIIRRFPLPYRKINSREPLWDLHLACWSPRGSYIQMFVSEGTFILTYPEWELASTEQMIFEHFHGTDCTADLGLLALPSTQILDQSANSITQSFSPCDGMSATWNPNGEREFAVNCNDGMIRVYSSDGELLQTLQGDLSEDSSTLLYRSILYSPDGRHLAALGNNSQFRVLSTANYDTITYVNVAELANSKLTQDE
jgi:WD40 repeat protein